MSFMQINPENYQSRPPLLEVAPLVHTDSSVNLTIFSLLFGLIELVGFSTDDGCVLCRSVGQSNGVGCPGPGSGRAGR